MHLVPSADADNASGTFLRRSLDGSGVSRSSFDAVWSETSVLLIFCELLNEPKDLDGLEPEGVSAGPWIDATRSSAYFAYSYSEDVGPSSVAFVLYSVPIMNSRSTFDSSAARILIVEPLWIYRSFAAHSPDIYMMFENASLRRRCVPVCFDFSCFLFCPTHNLFMLPRL